MAPKPADPSRLRRRRSIVLAATIAWLAAMVVLAILLAASQAGAREAVAERLAVRAAAGAEFASLYVQDIFEREHQQAGVWLSGPRPDRRGLENASGAMGVSASLLLDRHGRVLEVLPAKPELLGKVVTGKYQHLAAAVAGTRAVSNVVPSAARGVPVVAFAVPFQTRAGRRVFSGAFAVSKTPLGAYVSRIVSIPGRRVYLVDARGDLIASSGPASTGRQPLRQVDPRLARAAGSNSAGAYASPTGGQTFVTSEVAGTPWRMVAAVPDAALYNALDGASKWLAWIAVISLALAGLGVITIGSRLQRSRERLGSLNDELDRLARVDSLTGLRNRRDIEETLAATLSAARRHRSDLSVLLIDIDHFKQVNDTLGHEIGDVVLSTTARTIRFSVRAEDTVGRWGGEEFVAVLPFTDAAGALLLAERVREQVARSADPAVTVTIGVAAWQSGDSADLIGRADGALYAGKAAGRNKVQLAPAQHSQADPAQR